MEEEMTMTVEGQGEPGSSEEEAGVEMPTSPTKRAQDSPKKGRGRPKRKAESSKNEEEEDGDSSTPKKRGRPKGSPNKKPKLSERREVSSEQESPSESSSDSQSPAKKKQDGPWKRYKSAPKGTPVKDIKQKVSGSSSPAKRGRGRPKGSPMKTDPASGDPVTPKVWGRPRKYPKLETPPPPPARGRGRPRKTEERRGVHLRRAAPEPGAVEPKAANDASPRRRGRPLGRPLGSVKSPQGRPKGSPNKAKAAVDDVPAEDDQEERSEEESQDEAGQAEEGDDAGQEEEGDDASQAEEGDDVPAEADERRRPRGRPGKKSKRVPQQSESGEPHVGAGRRSVRVTQNI